MPRIALDAMGSDRHPEPEISASVEAVRLFGEEIILVGPQDVLQPKLDDLGGRGVRIVHAPAVFRMADHISGDALRRSVSSMAVGLKLVKAGEADVFVTMGNTGGAMANALFRLGRIRGVKRPALTALFPVKNGKCVVLDIGANAECKPLYLKQFAIMGSVYAQHVLGVDRPRVGLLSNGEEAGKGNELIRETYPLLAGSGLNFIGNVEGKELFAGEADVVVTDGFTGNVLLKSTEAVAKLLIEELHEQIYSSTRTKIGGLLAKPAFNALRSLLDPAEIGAIPLLGLGGLVFVGHGRSKPKAIVSAIRMARGSVDAGLLGALKSAIVPGLGNR